MSWPRVPLGELLRVRTADIIVDPTTAYQFAGVYSFGRGVFRGTERSGSTFAYRHLTRLREGDFIYPKLMAWEGAFGIVPSSCSGCYVSPEFPVFEVNSGRLLSRFLGYYFQIPKIWESVSGGSTGTNVRRRRLYPEQLLRWRMPLPPLEEQRLIVARIDDLGRRTEQVRALGEEITAETDAFLMSVYAQIAQSAPRRPMGEVAPLQRRPVSVDPESSYPQVAVRSFGKGTFHREPLLGIEVTWQKPFLVKAGDILISNIKAWEGAIAVALPHDDGRVGSHRYLTCVPVPGTATAQFVCFHLLTPTGLYDIGEASPGSADRNRTLSSTELLRIPIPVPSYRQQLWFDELVRKTGTVRRHRYEAAAELDAMLPALLDHAFRGEL
jgi:type I restriction enzyme S subunit